MVIKRVDGNVTRAISEETVPAAKSSAPTSSLTAHIAYVSPDADTQLKLLNNSSHISCALTKTLAGLLATEG